MNPRPFKNVLPLRSGFIAAVIVKVIGTKSAIPRAITPIGDICQQFEAKPFVCNCILDLGRGRVRHSPTESCLVHGYRIRPHHFGILVNL